MIQLILYIQRQRKWSRKTFGPGPRTIGIRNHILKELAEIIAEPTDLEEWIDVVILALDGAWRAGHNPATIVAMLERKQAINFKRKWPLPGPQDQATEHIRDQEGREYGFGHGESGECNYDE
jgi:hypothetical protein